MWLVLVWSKCHPFVTSAHSEKELYDTYNRIAESKDEALLVSLVEEGQLKPDFKSKEGMTPLMVAVDNNFSADTISKLIQMGCDVNAQTEDGMTCLHMSMWQENAEIFEVLLQNKADPSIEDESGECVQDTVDSKPLLDIFEKTMGYSICLDEGKEKTD